MASQPFANTPSQSAKPAPHAIPHAPPAHVEVAFARVAQRDPQDPQLAGLVERFTQTPPQSAVPVGHEAHAPATHACPLGHARPHMPQFVALVCRSTQAPPHSALPPAQPHAPAAQAPLPQVRPHPPQLAGSVWVLTHAPEHEVIPAPHAAPQSPPAHTCPLAQEILQLPQFALVRRSTSHPFEATRSQSPKPAAQASPHTPAAQVGVAFAAVGQARAHPPQFDGSVAVFWQYS